MTKEEHPLPPPQREPSPALARMYSMGVSTTSEGVDNFARVSGSFMRSTTKNPLLNNDNTNTNFEERKQQQPSKDYHQDEEQEPSRFYQREQSLARKLKHHEHDNALGKSFGRSLTFSSAKKKNQEERSLEEKKSGKETIESRFGYSARSNGQESCQCGEEDASKERLCEGVSSSCRF